MTYDRTDFLLNPCADLAIVGGDIVRVTGADIIRQMWLIRVRTWKGEWVLDTNHGVPYIQEVFSKISDKTRIEEIFREVTRNTPGVLLVESVDFQDFDTIARTVTIQVEAQIDGPEGASPITFYYDGSLPPDACTPIGASNFPLTISDLRIWFDSNDLANLTYNSPLMLKNKAATGKAEGDCTLQGVSGLGLKRAALFDSTLDERLLVTDTPAIQGGTGELTVFAVVKPNAIAAYPDRLGIFALNGLDPNTSDREFYNIALNVNAAADSSELVISGEEIGTTPVILTFQAFSGDSGVSNLPRNMTFIPGFDVAPELIYLGQDCDSSNWDQGGAGVILPVVVTGPAPTLALPTPFTDGTEAVQFNSGHYYQSPIDQVGDIGTKDFVLEFVLNADSTGNDTIISKRNGTGAGWYVHNNVTGNLIFEIEDDLGNSAALTAAILDHAWYHVLIVGQYGVHMHMYVNGKQAADASMLTLTGDTTNPAKFSLGSQNGSQKSSEELAYVSLWAAAGWLTSTTEPDLATERFMKLTGFWPAFTAGQTAPHLFGRDSDSVLEIQPAGEDIQIFRVGPNWPTFSQRDVGGMLIKGSSLEPSSNNGIGFSDNFANWDTIFGTDSINTHTVPCPDGEDHGSQWMISDVSGEHFLETSVDISSGDDTCFSVFAKSGTKSWIYLTIDGHPSFSAFFNVANGAIGTVANDTYANIDGPYVGGFWRCSIATEIDLGGTKSARMVVAEADGDLITSYSGPPLMTMGIFGAQIEPDLDASSLIYTYATAGTPRYVTSVIYKAGLNIGGADSQAAGVTVDLWGQARTRYMYLGVLGVTGDPPTNDDYVYWMRSSGGNSRALANATSGIPGTATAPASAIPDGNIHEAALDWATNDLVVYDDGLAGTPNNAVDIPLGMDLLHIAPTGGILSNLVIKNEPSVLPPSTQSVKSTTTIVGNNEPHIFVVALNAAGDVAMTVDGANVTVSSPPNLAIRSLDGSGLVGAIYDDNVHDLPVKFFNGNIGDVLVWDRVLTPDEHNAMINFLRTKWGI